MRYRSEACGSPGLNGAAGSGQSFAAATRPGVTGAALKRRRGVSLFTGHFEVKRKIAYARRRRARSFGESLSQREASFKHFSASPASSIKPSASIKPRSAGVNSSPAAGLTSAGLPAAAQEFRIVIVIAATPLATMIRVKTTLQRCFDPPLIGRGRDLCQVSASVSYRRTNRSRQGALRTCGVTPRSRIGPPDQIKGLGIVKLALSRNGKLERPNRTDPFQDSSISEWWARQGLNL
jgi:hypothetical protein